MYLLALTMGLGCGIGCGSLVTPFLTSYVIGKGKDMKESLLSFLAFSSGKISAMALLGALSSSIGQELLSKFGESLPFDLKYAFNAIMLFLGLKILHDVLKRDDSCGSCDGTCSSSKIDTDKKNKVGGIGEILMIFISGAVYGITPCGPLGIMLVTAANLTALEGALLLGFFGFVTCISPVILQCIMAGIVVPKMKREIPGKMHLISILSACILIYMGISPVFNILLKG